jgi:hypothetical protein
MKPEQKIVISASRRTDIPAFYMPWFMDQIEKGMFEVQNPYNRRVSKINATPGQVHSLLFWSKNFSPFLKKGYGERLVDLGYHLFFNFTINSDDRLLEPNVPSLQERLAQLATLCQIYGPKCIQWRFDPICIYDLHDGSCQNNLKDFTLIADTAHKLGVKRCITSFMDLYPKIQKRTSGNKRVAFTIPTMQAQREILLSLHAVLGPKKIQLFTCCEKTLLDTLPLDAGIRPSACVPNDLLMELFGGHLSLRKDAGQRKGAGCGCYVSTDIGSYQHHPCYHNCRYCYANPTDDGGKTTGQYMRRGAVS